MRILYLEDHEFFAGEIIDYVVNDTPHDIFYAKTYKEAEYLIEKHGSFDCSILDVILQNGKTGILLAETYKDILGDIMFVTGCNDTITLKALENYKYVAKMKVIWDDLDDFLTKKKEV